MIRITLKFVPKGPIDNNPALVQIMAWRRPGDKPLSEPKMVRLLTHICVTWPQWVNGLLLTAPSHYMNRCWFIITAVQWQSLEGNFTKAISAINYLNYLEDHGLNFHSNFRGTKQLNVVLCLTKQNFKKGVMMVLTKFTKIQKYVLISSYFHRNLI